MRISTLDKRADRLPCALGDARIQAPYRRDFSRGSRATPSFEKRAVHGAAALPSLWWATNRPRLEVWVYFLFEASLAALANTRAIELSLFTDLIRGIGLLGRVEGFPARLLPSCAAIAQIDR